MMGIFGWFHPHTISMPPKGGRREVVRMASPIFLPEGFARAFVRQSRCCGGFVYPFFSLSFGVGLYAVAVVSR